MGGPLSHPPIEPDADPSRRAWLACPNCDHGVGCPECQSSRNCGTHWRYLLKNSGTRVSLQCPSCYCVWTVDTAFPDRHAAAMVHRNTHRDAGPDVNDNASSDPAATHFDITGHEERDEAVVANVWLGDCPSEIVTNRDGGLIYVLTADSVKVVDGSHHVVASIPIGSQPKQMLMSSDGSRIYVTTYDRSIWVINPVDMTAKAFAAPRSTGAVVSPDGNYIYLSHGELVGDRSSWVSVVRADGASVALIAVDHYTTGMALSPDGRRLYVASAGGLDGRGGTIAVVDTTSHRSVNFIAVDEAPHSLAVDLQGFLYVTHYHTNSLSLVDPRTRSVVLIALDDAPIDVVAGPEHTPIYTVNLHSITAIDIWTTTSKTLAIGELPRRLKASADGRRLYATDFAHGTVWVLDTSNNSIMGTVETGIRPAAVALSTDGELLYVTDSRNGTLAVISTSLVKSEPEETH